MNGCQRDRPKVEEESGVFPHLRQHRVQAARGVVGHIDPGGKRSRQGAVEEDDADRGPIAPAQRVVELAQRVDVQHIQRWAIQCDASDPILDPDRDWNRWRLGCRHRR